MRYILLIYSQEKQWAEMSEQDRGRVYGEYMAFTEGIKKSGHYKAGDPLHPTSSATTVRMKSGKAVTTDGPFAETREQLGGYYIVEARNLDEANEIAGRVPGARYGSIEVRPIDTLPERLDAVLVVLYVVFNEGYAATSGEELTRRELSAEAIRLARLLTELVPESAEARALLALMLLHDSRRNARVSAGGDLVRLEDQDRSQWDREEIREGLALTESALRHGGPGSYALQAAIAALHAEAARPEDTDWRQIVELYRELLDRYPSPVIALNHAAAVAEAFGPELGLKLLDNLEAGGELASYHLLPAARGRLLVRLERPAEAAEAYRRALSLVATVPERRFLQGRARANRERRRA